MLHLIAEFRLLIFVSIQSLVLFACWRFAARCASAGNVQRLIDTLLLTYLVQYVAVGLPGMMGWLSPATMLVVATALAGGFILTNHWLGAKDASLAKPQAARFDRAIVLAGTLFIAGYVAAFVWQQRYLPPMAIDALTYQLPAAAQWIQHGRIDLFQTWFFNPANTYSPLAGSIFYAWLLGPIGNDALAHLGCAPMIGLLFLAMLAAAREMGGSTKCAVLAALAICLCRPIINQIDKGKDDLFLAAFFAVAVAALSPRRLCDPFGPYRIGSAIGLCLATKYTALLALPMLLLAIDAPIRSGWKISKWLIPLACVAVIAGPWYLRNYIETRNPVFPADFLGFRGLFSTSRSLELRSLRGVLGVLLNNSFAITGLFGGILLLVWLAAWTRLKAPGWRDPLTRLCLIGPAVGMTIFIGFSPYPEVRFIVPALILLVAAVGSASRRFGWFEPAVLLAAAVVTGLQWQIWDLQFTFLAAGLITAGAGLGVAWLMRRLRIDHEKQLLVGGCVVVLIAGYGYVNWTAFEKDRDELATDAWSRNSGDGVWRYVRTQLPRSESLAYTGISTVYPLMGSHLDRPIGYVPTRAGLKTIADLPRLGGHLPGERIAPTAVAAMIADPDRAVWLSNLRHSGAKHLAVFVDQNQPAPSESLWAAAMPDRFKLEYQDNEGMVYRIRE